MTVKDRPQLAERLGAIVIFVDIRGFTQWLEATEVFQHSPELLFEFFNLLRNRFPDFYFESSGDGALLLKEIPQQVSPARIKNHLRQLLKNIEKVQTEFAKICASFAVIHGHHTQLALGWGVTRGVVARFLTKDNAIHYLGANINKAARLCDLARPFGIVLESDDFSELPKPLSRQFFPQIRKLKGISDEVNVWVSREIYVEFYRREELRHCPEVHVAGFCIRDDSQAPDAPFRLLVARRNPDRHLYPGLYEGCGGQLAFSEDFTQGVARHYLTEMGLTVEVLRDFHLFYLIREPQTPIIPGIRFLARYHSGEPKSLNHSEIRWVSLPEFRQIPDAEFIPGLKTECLELMNRWQLHLEHTS